MKIDKATLLQELHNHAEKFLMENFGMHFNIPIKINARLRTTGGRFRYRTNTINNLSTPIDIEIAKFICENATIDKLLNILEHECVHYALFELGLPYADSDIYFIETCKRLNVCLSHNIAKENYSYVCPECGVVKESNRKIPKGYYTTCKHCGGRITKEHLAKIKNMKVRQVI